MKKMSLSNIEYITLRIIRKFFFTTNLLNYVGKYIPYYQTNKNQQFPNLIVSNYLKYCTQNNIDLKSKTVLEIGIGSTNSVGYELVALTDCNYIGIEPFVDYNSRLDGKLLEQINNNLKNLKRENVIRLKQIELLADKSVDVIFSNSVLEHVTDMDLLILQLKRVIKQGGCMIHLVDYRDHFFKYPYHFLQFSEKTWNRWLNPGDLPRWRVLDHVELIQKHGFYIEIIESESNEKEFLKIVKKIHKEYSNYRKYALQTLKAVLFVKKSVF